MYVITCKCRIIIADSAFTRPYITLSILSIKASSSWIQTAIWDKYIWVCLFPLYRKENQGTDFGWLSQGHNASDLCTAR